MGSNESGIPPVLLEENLKKALTELLMLQLLSRRQYYIGELTEELKQKSDGALSIVFPYSAIYRLQQSGCIQEIEKRIAPDGRRRQYFEITDIGRVYFAALRKSYGTFISGVNAVLYDEEN